MIEGGKKIWYFADGYLPEPKDNGKMVSHEALMIFNTSTVDVESSIDVYFSEIGRASCRERVFRPV